MEDNDKDDDNNKNDNTDKGISALGLDRDLRFSRRHQGHQRHWPHYDDEKVENNDKDNNNNNNKDNNNDKGISALGLDRDLGFSRGHQ